MKKRLFFAALLSAALLAGCNGGGDAEPTPEVVNLDFGSGTVDTGSATETTGTESIEEVEEEPVPEGMYRSELTNEIISEDLKDQRPVAIMVDNETYAYPHIGLNQADVVYEIMNSTKNGRITRLMCLVKDWKNIKQFGSVRSTRPTNFMLAGEWNAILCHDGGPYYNNAFVARDYTDNLSGGFARFSNGKATEFTEYITSDDYTNPSTGKSYQGLINRIKDAGYSETYNQYHTGNDFTFAKGGNRQLSDKDGAEECTYIKLPMQHTGSELKYNEETNTYDYYVYGDPHEDPSDDNKILSFKNVILQKADFSQLDNNGYLVYNILVAEPWDGYYCTNGKSEPIVWAKLAEEGNTYYSEVESGKKLEMNTGKTYICLVPDDQWDDLVMK